MGWRDLLEGTSHRPGPWPEWATGRGFVFAEDGNELIGRYLPAGEGENYYNVVRGRWRERPFVYFQRVTHASGGRGRSNQFSEGCALQLPGTPRADLLDMTPEEAFRAAGGRLPSTGVWSWRPPDELLHVGEQQQPVHLERLLENVTAQLAAAPAALWQG